MRNDRARRIYLDNAASTFPDPSVIRRMAEVMTDHSGNAASTHWAGLDAAICVERTRAIIARAINAEIEEVIFTSGGTESNNLALKGIALANKGKGRHLVVSSIEHPSILECAKDLARRGFFVTYLPVDREGRIGPEVLRKNLRKDTVLVSIMAANNEIGTVQDLEKLGRICRERKIIFHTDACQYFTKDRLDVKAYNLDSVSLSAQKIHGPQGVGALYLRNGIRIEPHLHGGGQEHSIRPGTVNVAGIAGFGRAVEVSKRSAGMIRELGRYFVRTLQSRVSGVSLNGAPSWSLPHIVSLTVEGVPGKVLAAHLDRHGIAVSTGSACSSLKPTASHVLRAIGLTDREAMSTIRIGLDKWTTREQLDQTIRVIESGVRTLRKGL